MAPRPAAGQRADPGATRHAPQRKPGKRQDHGQLGTAQAKPAERVWMTAHAEAKRSPPWSHRGTIR